MTCVIIAFGGAAIAQTPIQAPAEPPPSSGPTIERTADTATVSFFNRPIVVLRARVLGRGPAERALGAERVLHDLVAQRITGPIEARPLSGGMVISVASRGVLFLAPADADDLGGETLDAVAAQAVANLRVALGETVEARAPAMLLREAATALPAIALAVLVLWAMARARQRLGNALTAIAERRIAEGGAGALDALHASRVLELQRHCVTALITAADLVVVYGVITFVLRRFPYTRPWGESMSGFLLATAATLGLDAIHALPGLFTVALILVFTRVAARLAAAWFRAIEHGQITARLIHPETAQPTRRLVTALLWIFAAIVAYPYMPGSESEAFKGVSVFIGLMVTFGSSGLVNHVMSGFMITYSRALRVGDFVKIGEVEGTVLHLGVLSTRVRTIFHEEITIPNAVVVAQTTTDYSRTGDVEGVFTPTSVTIGYDAPWRQVHALLLLAAARTPGLRAEPRPRVLQTSLEDFYVKYTLLVSLAQQGTRAIVFDALHANIQDLFNEYGVQIMSPNYVLDPAAPKVVPKGQWFAAPARPAPFDARDAGPLSSTVSTG